MEVCDLHLEMMATIHRIENKLDNHEERRSILMDDIAYVKHAIDNGLRKDLKDASCEIMAMGKKMDETITAFDKKYEGVVEFKWFRELVTDFRNNLFKNFLKFVLVVGIAYVMTHFGSAALTGIIDKVFK
jgi:hypothetical protein